jgi:hypothetical protein
MATPKFRVGDTVELIPVLVRSATTGEYQIVRQLPEVGGEFRYRIKSVQEPHERSAKESELRRVPTSA